MAAGEIKVSVMTFLETVPDNAKIYVVKEGDTTPYYTTKAALLSGSAGDTPTLAEVLTVGGREIKIIYASAGDYTVLESDKNKSIVLLCDENMYINYDISIFSIGDEIQISNFVDGVVVILPTGGSSSYSTLSIDNKATAYILTTEVDTCIINYRTSITTRTLADILDVGGRNVQDRTGTSSHTFNLSDRSSITEIGNDTLAQELIFIDAEMQVGDVLIAKNIIPSVYEAFFDATASGIDTIPNLPTFTVAYGETLEVTKLAPNLLSIQKYSYQSVGGSQTLAQTLVLGNTTDGENISISDGDAVALDNTSKLKKGTTNAGLGGNNGIALKCSLDYELKWEAGRLYIMEQDGITIRESRYNFANNPTVTDDVTKGYINGSRWIKDGGQIFQCVDATTGSAIWSEVTPIVDLSYTASPTNGIIITDTTSDVTLPLADGTNAGLLQPADFTQLSTLATDLANINTDAVDKVTVKLALGITKGQAVYISSASGTNIIVSKASNTSEATSSKTLGLLATTGVTNDIVTVVTSGLLDGLDTSTATVGDPVWLGVSGNLIFGLASKPVAPAHLVYIGVVSRVHATVGEIFVRVQNGFELKEIHDVLITSVADNDILAYESSTSLWENKTSSALGLATQAQVDLRTREILQDFTDYTSTGVLTEQIISNQAITANDMKINSWLNLISTYSRTGTTNATVSIYLSTNSNNIAGAVKIATATITSTQSLPCFKRDFSINASSVLRGMLFSANAVTDEIATQAQSTTTLTLGSAYYLISTVTLNNVADTVTQRAINLKSSK